MIGPTNFYLWKMLIIRLRIYQILRKIAEAFDLTLCVSFESFGRRIEDIERFRRETLERNSFDNDGDFKEQSMDESAADLLMKHYSQDAGRQPDKQPKGVVSSLNFLSSKTTTQI